jgi:dCMP deaminase
MTKYRSEVAMIWNDRWMQQVALAASWSKDRSRKIGAAAVNDRNVLLSIGWNGFPRGVNDDIEARHARPAKYLWTEHAERNLIYNAAAEGISLLGATLFTQLFPCADCARGVIQSGFVRVVCPNPDWNDPKYADDFSVADVMLREAGVIVEFVQGQSPIQRAI